MPRSEMQKGRRRARWLAQADDRRRLAELELEHRYGALKIAMSRVGVQIGPISDLAERIEDPVRRFEVLKARVERWEALWAIALRKRITRGKIIIGGAVLAEVCDLVMEDPSDQAFLVRLTALLDRRVPRVQDRAVIRGLLIEPGRPSVALPLRPGGPLEESIEAALRALGEAQRAFADEVGEDGENSLGEVGPR
jgi:hypothetical protein